MESMDIEEPSRHEDIVTAPAYVPTKSSWVEKHGISGKVFALALVVAIIIIALLGAILSSSKNSTVGNGNDSLNFEGLCGKYQWYDEKNMECKRCSECDDGTNIIVECTDYSDTVCGHCRAGYFLDLVTNVCEPCPDGCTHCKFEELDGLVCLPCLSGFYYRQGSLGTQGHCARCTTSCPPGEKMFFPCSNDKDITCGVPGIFAEGEFAGSSWEDIETKARGGTCNFWMWDGGPRINDWVNGYLKITLKEVYGINLQLVPAPERLTSKIVELVEGEKEADILHNGLVDLMWINGVNFKRSVTQDLLYGPWAGTHSGLPSAQWYDFTASNIAYDYGYPTDGYEFPYNSAQVVFWYNSEKVPTPPRSIPDFIQWIKDNPGKFTYSQSMDFTGLAFIKHVFYYYAGFDIFLGPQFNEALYLEHSPRVWEVLNEIEPFLYDPGNYPRLQSTVRDLYCNESNWVHLAFDPSAAGGLVDDGVAPASTRTFVFDEGTIADTNFLAIPFNSGNKAAALVAANFIGSLNASYSRALPENWGALQAIDLDRVPAEWKEKFENIPRHEITLSPEVLASHRIGELGSAYQIRIEEDWVRFVQNA